MQSPEEQFIHELEVFRTESHSALQFVYTFLGVKAILSRDKQALDAVNRTPLFWRTNLGALQTAYIIVFGRVFDQNSKHNIDSVLSLAQHNVTIFSKSALAARKRRGSSNADEWLEGYLNSVYEPATDDFRRLRQYVKKYRRLYEQNYRDLRRKVFAHKEISDRESVEQLFARTNVRELEKLSVFLNRLYEALWQLLHNGRRPVLRHMRYSVHRIGKAATPRWKIPSVQEEAVKQVHEFFDVFKQVAQQRAPANAANRKQRKRERATFVHRSINALA